MTAITILMNLYVFPMTALLTVAGIILSPVLFLVITAFTCWKPYRVVRLLIWLYGRAWLFIISPFVGYKREWHESKRIKRPCIIVVNHLSFFDTYFTCLLPFSNVCFAVRSWPFKILFYRPFMLMAGYLDVESFGWDKILKTGEKYLSNGSAILFFPEGHRSRDGNLQKFYTGAFRLAVETGVDIVPVCITGSDRFLPPGRWWLSPATVRFNILPPVPSEQFSGPSAHIEMKKYVKQIMAKTIENMEKERER